MYLKKNFLQFLIKNISCAKKKESLQLNENDTTLADTSPDTSPNSNLTTVSTTTSTTTMTTTTTVATSTVATSTVTVSPSLRFIGLNWTADYENKSSNAYIDLASQIRSLVITKLVFSHLIFY